jgi:hypothetical protein
MRACSDDFGDLPAAQIFVRTKLRIPFGDSGSAVAKKVADFQE